MTADDLAKVLDELGKRIGPAGEYVFGLAVRQVYIDAATSIVFAVVTAAIWALAWPRVYRWVQDGDSYSDREIVGILLGIAAFSLAIIAAVSLACSVPALFNPEYAAIRNLIGAIK